MTIAKLIAAVLLVGGAGAAPAVVITYDATLDPGTGTLSSSQYTIPLTGAALSLLPGDTLQGTISFTGGAAATLTNVPTSPGDGYEYLSLEFHPTTAGTVHGDGQLSFLGVSGDYTSLPVLTIFSDGLLSAGAFRDLTPTAFSFTGISYSITYDDGTPTTFLPTSLVLGYDVSFGAAPTPAPEAATWAMMVGGFGIVGSALRRRARGAALIA